MSKDSVVFVDIDTQRDFLEPGGALFIPNTEAIIVNLQCLTAFARERGIPVLATGCAHKLDDPDPEPFPPHCVVGTPGQSRIPATAWPGSVVVDRDGRGPDAIVAHVTLEKRYYDLFTHPDAERLITMYGSNRPTFVVYGVATDYCVKCAVLGLLDRGQRVALVVDAIRAVDPAHEAEDLAEFVRRGALLTVTDAVCGDWLT
jgi:nicotinamidase/pyrazinamidase